MVVEDGTKRSAAAVDITGTPHCWVDACFQAINPSFGGTYMILICLHTHVPNNKSHGEGGEGGRGGILKLVPYLRGSLKVEQHIAFQ